MQEIGKWNKYIYLCSSRERKQSVDGCKETLRTVSPENNTTPCLHGGKLRPWPSKRAKTRSQTSEWCISVVGTLYSLNNRM